MKKFGIFFSGLALVFLLAGCGAPVEENGDSLAPANGEETSAGQNDADLAPGGETEGLAMSCENAGGTWLADYNECEYIGEDWCLIQGGEFSDCESACRHDPEAEFCTFQCVFVCKFSGDALIN